MADGLMTSEDNDRRRDDAKWKENKWMWYIKQTKIA